MRDPTQRETGFTLIEILVAVSIVGLLMVAVYGTLGLMARSSLQYHHRLSCRLAGRIALDQIARCLRCAKEVRIRGPSMAMVTTEPLLGDQVAFGSYKVQIRFDQASGALVFAQEMAGRDSRQNWHEAIDSVRYVRWGAWDGQRWTDTWEQDRLPSLVRVELGLGQTDTYQMGASASLYPPVSEGGPAR